MNYYEHNHYILPVCVQYIPYGYDVYKIHLVYDKLTGCDSNTAACREMAPQQHGNMQRNGTANVHVCVSAHVQEILQL